MNQSPFRVAIILFVAIAGILFAAPNFLPQQVREALLDGCPSQAWFLVSICRAVRTCCSKSIAGALSPSA